MRGFVLALAGTAALNAAAPAEAATTVVDYDFYNIGFGTMSLNYDSDTSEYSLNALNLHAGGGAYTAFNASLFGSGPNYWLFGNQDGLALGPGISGYDFYFRFDPGLNNQTVDFIYYASPIQFLGSLTLLRRVSDPVSGGVPEPTTWAMMLLGFGVIGFSMRRRRLGQFAIG
jgi:hypothetical protein